MSLNELIDDVSAREAPPPLRPHRDTALLQINQIVRNHEPFTSGAMHVTPPLFSGYTIRHSLAYRHQAWRPMPCRRQRKNQAMKMPRMMANACEFCCLVVQCVPSNPGLHRAFFVTNWPYETTKKPETFHRMDGPEGLKEISSSETAGFGHGPHDNRDRGGDRGN